MITKWYIISMTLKAQTSASCWQRYWISIKTDAMSDGFTPQGSCFLIIIRQNTHHKSSLPIFKRENCLPSFQFLGQSCSVLAKQLSRGAYLPAWPTKCLVLFLLYSASYRAASLSSLLVRCTHKCLGDCVVTKAVSINGKYLTGRQ